MDANVVAGNPLGYEKISKLILRFAVPAIVSMVVNAIYNIIDQVLIGWSELGMLGIAATTVSFPLTTIAASAALMMAVGGASNFNLNLGRGNREKAGQIAGNALSFGLILGAALMIAALVLIEPMLRLFGASDTSMPYALQYTRIIIYGLPFQVLSTVFGHLIRADGSPRYSMFLMLSGAVFNLIFDPLFLFVFKLGISGIAWTSSIGFAISTFVGLIYVMRSFHSAPVHLSAFRPRLEHIRAIMALGIASFFNQIAMTVMQIVLNNTLSGYGGQSVYGSDIPIAAVGSISKINTIAMAFVFGIGQGCQPINGYNYGAKNYDRVRKTFLTAMTAGTVISIITMLIYQLLPAQLLSIFGANTEEFYRFGTSYLRVFMFMAFLNSVQPICSNFFTSIGKAQKGIFISMTRQIIFLIPLLLILPLFLGIEGILFAGPAADLAAAAVGITLAAGELRKMKTAGA